MNQTPKRRPKPVSQRDGSKLQFSNCRMASVSTGLDFHSGGFKTSNGGKMRTYTADQSGGTDSRDAREAWLKGYGEALRVEDGSPFSDVVAGLRAGRAVNLDVWHETLGGPCLSGAGRYGHNIFVLPDCEDGRWLVSDPWCSPAKWNRVSESALKRAAEEWGRRVFDSSGDSGFDRDTVADPDTAGDPNPQTPEEWQDWLGEQAKALMERWTPDNEAPPGEGDPDPDDDETSGTQVVLFTTTNRQPLVTAEETEGMDKLMGTPGMLRNLAIGTPHFSKPGGTQEGTIKSDLIVYVVVAKYTDSAGKNWFLINGGSDGNMGWVRDADIA